jgi:putative membrane protein
MKLLGLAAFLVGACLLFTLVVHAGLEPVLGVLGTMGPQGLVLIGLVHLPVVGLLGLAWWTIHRSGTRPAVLRFVWARAVRDASAEALPFSQLGGYAIGARALSLAGADVTAAGASTFLDLIVEFAAKIQYMLLGLALFADFRSHRLVAAALIVLCLCTMVASPFLRTPLQKLTRINFFPRWRGLRSMRRRAALALGRMTARGEGFPVSILLHLVCWVLGAGETWLIFHLMHVAVSLPAALVIDSLVGAIRAASFFVPVSIGVQEGGYVLLCGLFGISPATALAFSLARRARDFLIAAPVLLSWQWREAQALFPAGTGRR